MHTCRNEENETSTKAAYSEFTEDTCNSYSVEVTANLAQQS